MFQQLYSFARVWINELNIHSPGNLSLNKISLNVRQRFQRLIPTSLKQFYSNPTGPLAFSIFIQFITHHTFSTSILLIAPSTLLASMQSHRSFSTFINFSICSFHIFFQSSTLTFTAPL